MFSMNTLHWKNLHDDFVKHTLANKILITFLLMLTNSLYNPPVKGNYKVGKIIRFPSLKLSIDQNSTLNMVKY